jgi:hypothetical protein
MSLATAVTGVGEGVGCMRAAAHQRIYQQAKLPKKEHDPPHPPRRGGAGRVRAHENSRAVDNQYRHLLSRSRALMIKVTSVNKLNYLLGTDDSSVSRSVHWNDSKAYHDLDYINILTRARLSSADSV